MPIIAGLRDRSASARMSMVASTALGARVQTGRAGLVLDY